MSGNLEPLSPSHSKQTWVLAGLLIVTIWACIYLPGLGRPELRGEEPRRVLPARTMLQTGDWVVPYWGGEPYSSKPPLINWCAAFFMNATGSQEEAVVRLPSVFSVLSVALGLFILGGRLTSFTAGFVASILFLVAEGTLGKGHILEIEALYVACTGLALLWWLERAGRGQLWAAWLGAGLLLGLGMLAKGPLHLLMFLLPVAGYQMGSGALRQGWLRPQPWVGLALAVALFLLWAIPNQQMNPSNNSSAIWKSQMMDKLAPNDFSLIDWLSCLPKILLDFAPASLALPLFWRVIRRKPEVRSESSGALSLSQWRGLIIGVFLALLLIACMPASKSRFAMPLLVPFCLVAGWLITDYLREKVLAQTYLRRIFLVLGGALCVGLVAAPFVVGGGVDRDWLPLATGLAGAFVLFRQGGRAGSSLERLFLLLGIVAALGWQAYLHLLWPFQQKREKLRPVAAAVLSAAGYHGSTPEPVFPLRSSDGFSIVAVGVGEQPFLYYLGPGCREVAHWQELVTNPELLLLSEKYWQKERKNILKEWGMPPRRTTIQTTEFRSNWKLPSLILLDWRK